MQLIFPDNHQTSSAGTRSKADTYRDDLQLVCGGSIPDVDEQETTLKHLVIVPMLLGVLLGGCAPAGTAESGKASGPQSPSQSPAIVLPSISPPPSPLSSTSAVAYVLLPDLGYAYGMWQKHDYDKSPTMLSACVSAGPVITESDKRNSGSRTREFRGFGEGIGQVVYALPRPAREVVELQNLVQADCPISKTPNGGRNLEVVRVSAFQMPRGAEGAEAYCSNQYADGQETYTCSVALARGQIYCKFYTWSPSRLTALALLEQFLPQVAQRVDQLPT